jgi:hypothetical protein
MFLHAKSVVHIAQFGSDFSNRFTEPQPKFESKRETSSNDVLNAGIPVVQMEKLPG